ncbi:MAG: virion core protein, T7 gp14 family [Pseudomonadota bacterium]
MCVDPVTLSVGTTVLSTGLGIADRLGQAGAAGSAHAASIAHRNAVVSSALNETIPSIYRSLGQVYNSNSARANQESDAAATESFDILREMVAAKATAQVAASEAGVGGVSFANILQDLEMREGLAKGTIDLNYAYKVQQIDDDNQQAYGRAKGQASSVINAAIQGTPIAPEPVAPWAGIGGDAAKGGLQISKDLGLFDKKPKIDTNTGRTVNTDRAKW